MALKIDNNLALKSWGKSLGIKELGKFHDVWEDMEGRAARKSALEVLRSKGL